MKKMTVFSWGFWGWGKNAKRFVQVVDKIEAARGFKPPVFVDVRLRRTGRAINFKDNAFGDLVGEQRYYWLKGLGNAAIEDDTLNPITIKDPKEIRTLLDLAIKCMKDKRRIIFFCACERPITCHRYHLGTLLLKEAKKRSLALEVVEWPGGKPQILKEKASKILIGKIRKGQVNYPLAKNANMPLYASLPWGTVIELTSESDTLAFISGPAKYIKDKWALPVAILPDKGESISKLKKIASQFLNDDYSSRIS